MKKKICVFKPYNARKNNAFDSGQYPIFKRLHESGKYEVTFFLDDESVKFDGVINRYIKKNKVIDLYFKLLRKLFNIPYIKLPYYGNIDFSYYDIIITEGLHYPFLKYFFNYKGKLILNDTITAEARIKKLNSNLINTKFKDAMIVVVNNKIPLLYKKYGINIKTETIGHALQLDKIKFKERRKFNGKMVSVGRLVKEKGYIYIFKAVKNLLSIYPHITLDIYGSGPLKENLLTYIKSNNLNNNIFLKGNLKYSNLLEKLNEYDLFISHPIETEYIAEAFHMANMEAMANGIPVITTDCGGVPYVVKDKAIVNKQKDIKAIENSIQILIQNNILFNQMSIEGRKFVEENYSLDIVYSKWKKIL